ncbi:hypothetical protein [Sphingomonas sp.]|uniref:hypothetical protein n=1 Tax=Sphingomonas sp. TaxID=28214 RepID=UPI00286AD59C|nr:hypothetical protein [Sphingomonas sp.]
MLTVSLILSLTIAASGDWAAFDRGGSCEAVSRSLSVPRKGDDQPRVAITFDRAGLRRGEVSVRLRRAVRPGSSVILTIGEQPFLLPGRGGDAWSRGPRQESAIIAAIRREAGMRVEARDTAGRRTVDRYSLGGAPTAIDAAAARCASKR